MFKVIRPFFDSTNNRKPYSKGDLYSHEDEGRIALLIEKGFLEDKASKISESSKEFPVHLGGGYYELPNGKKVRGKENAEKAMRGELR